MSVKYSTVAVSDRMCTVSSSLLDAVTKFRKPQQKCTWGKLLDIYNF